MRLRSFRTFQGLILAALGIFLLMRIMDGQILLYINQRFVILILLAALGFLFLSQYVFRERTRLQKEDLAQQDCTPEIVRDYPHSTDKHTAQGWVLWLMMLPVIIGLFTSPRPLTASALKTRGINTGSFLSTRQGSSEPLQIPSSQRSVLDWIRIASEYQDGMEIDGQMADVTGFVYHDPRLDKTQFMVSRFSIACCVADAVAVGVVVDWTGAPGLAESSWVRVTGPVYIDDFDGNQLPVIHAEAVESVPEPEQPYIFP